MKKLLVAGFSLVAVCLLVLGSQANVVGYQTVQASQQATIKESINQKELLFQTICDLANNKEIQKAILTSQFPLGFKTQPINIPTLTKKQLDVLYQFSLILSKPLSLTKIKSIAKQHSLPTSLQTEFKTVIKFNSTLEKEVQQLTALDCHCNIMTTSISDVVCAILIVLMFGSMGIALGLESLMNILSEKGLTILSGLVSLIAWPFVVIGAIAGLTAILLNCFYGPTPPLGI